MMDWVHFTTLDRVHICVSTLALMTNARAYVPGMKSSLVLCGDRFFAKEVIMLNQYNPSARLDGDVLDRVNLAPAIIFRELLHLRGGFMQRSDGSVYNPDRCKLFCWQQVSVSTLRSYRHVTLLR